MAVIPVVVKESQVQRYLAGYGIEVTHQGKVRNTYQPRVLPSILLLEATDRVSTFDKVLPVCVPKKGEVLTALTHFWLTGPLAGFPNHLLSSIVDPHLNSVHDLRRLYPELPVERCLVVNKQRIPPFEMIYRGHLGGSVYKDYLKNGIVAGRQLPPNIPKWAKLDRPMFTPSTKAEKGSDVNITVEEYLSGAGSLGQLNADFFQKAYEVGYAYAESRGILLLDTKFEGLLSLADEVLTPDSSRYTTTESLATALAAGKEPTFYDKQFVREYVSKVETPWGVGVQSLKPENPKHLAWIESSLRVPEDVVIETTRLYLQIFEMLVGMPLPDYQRIHMGCVLAAGA